MKKTLLQEVKDMNRIAGTQMTKEQEIALIRERLQQLNELEFGTQKAFDSYQKQHDLRGDTKVTVAGKKMSVSQAVKQSGDKALKGSPVFGNNKGGEVFGKKTNTKKTDWDDEDSVREFDSKVQSTLNKAIGDDSGYTNTNSAGTIEYNLETKNGADPVYTLYIGEDEMKKGKVRVSIQPSDNTYDPVGLGGKVDKSFDNEDDAMKFAGQAAKKHKKQLEMGVEKFDKAKAEASNAIDLILKNAQGNENAMHSDSNFANAIISVVDYAKSGKLDKKELDDAWDEYNKKDGDHKPLANLILRSMIGK